MKIIICFIIIIILLYFSFKIRENFDPKISNIVSGAKVNLIGEFKNYSIIDYNSQYSQYNNNLETNILFYKFETNSEVEYTHTYNEPITLGFYLFYPKNKLNDTPLATTLAATTPAATTAAATTLAATTAAATTLAATTATATTATATTATATTAAATTAAATTAAATTAADTTGLKEFIAKLRDVGVNSGEQKFTVTIEDDKTAVLTIGVGGNESVNITYEIAAGSEPFYFNTKNWGDGDGSVQTDLNNFIDDGGKLYSYYAKYISLYISENFLYLGLGPENDHKITSIKPVDGFVNYKEGFQSGGGDSSVDNVLTITNGDGNDAYNLKTHKQSDGKYTVSMTNTDNSINMSLPNLVLNNIEDLGWFLITINKDEIKLSFQNNPYITIKKSLNNIDISISSIKFNKINGNNYRYVGRILIWDKINLSLEEICKNYYCGQYNCRFNLKELQDKDKDNLKWSSLGNYDADLCIKECKLPEYRCNIKECQEMCIECNTPDEDELTKTQKLNTCPWLDNIKIDMKEPQPPFIRGFPGIIDNNDPNNGSIVIEWKKPYNNMSKITHYLLEIKESLSKYQSHKLITIEHNNCDICEYNITNLKNQTSYDVQLSAVNSIGISYQSNKITVTTKGSNNDFLKNIYKDISGDNVSFSEYKCVREFNNSDHILDQVMDEDINVYDYVKSMEE